MTVPFKVKAIYEYRSEEPDDLDFDNGQIMTVTEEDDADWYTGEYTTADGRVKEGIFPRNFVEKYEPAVPSRPARAPRRVPQPEPATTAPGPSSSISDPIAPPPGAAPPSDAHAPSKEAELEPPKEIARSVPPPKQEPQPASSAATSESKPAVKKPPPVVEKPSSFRDRIAAFNKPAAAPVAPFKPSAGSGTGFIKKPFVAPPPSRNAYVPPPRDIPPPTVYRREEEVDNERVESANEPAPPVVSGSSPQDGDQPKPTSLKDRIALLQQQQLEQAQRQAELATKKEKPKRPTKPRTESSELPHEDPEDGSRLEKVSTEVPAAQHQPEEEELSSRRSFDEPTVTPTPLMPSRELVSDTNDADDSGAADTDAQDVSTEEERTKSKPVKSPPTADQTETTGEGEDNEEDTEEEEDPDIRRRRELRERMAKMSGGMGMMGMFGGGGAPAPQKQKSVRRGERQPHREPEEENQTERAAPVPIMALPGMSNFKIVPKPAASESDEEDQAAQPTPLAAQDSEIVYDDHISQTPSRRSTERSQPLSPQDRAPPPPPTVVDRPEPPHSPGARPVPPTPPATRHVGDLPLARQIDSDHAVEAASTASAPSISSTAALTTSHAVPQSPPIQPRPIDTSSASKSVPPVPMSPTSPQSRPPPPPPPSAVPPPRSTIQSSLQAPGPDDSEDEVTEYDGDYDTDIASDAKHKTALKSHNRDSSFDEGALSNDSTNETRSPPARAVPPPIPSSAPRDVPPPPPDAMSRPRESIDVPRAAPPPLPQVASRPHESVDESTAAPPPIPSTQSAPLQRQSVDSPRSAPPPIPPPKSPAYEEEYDPYRYSGPPTGLPGMVSAPRKSTEEFDNDYTTEPQYSNPPLPRMERAAPPPPPMERAIPPPPTERQVPPPPPAESAPTFHEPDSMSLSGGQSATKQNADLTRSNTTSRRSADVPRPGTDQSFIASDVDLAPNSMWWTRDNNAPPALLNRNDILWEVESSTQQKRGGKASVSRDVYVLYQDYSQSTINATYDASEPSHVSFEQSHERPPIPPRKDQLEHASETFGGRIAKGAEQSLGSTIGEGTAQDFVMSLIRPLPSALLPVGTRAYGALVYANLGNATTHQTDEIRAGDIITFRSAKFAGHKGGLHQKYSQEVGKPEHVAVVIDWDGTKKKIRAWEQGNQEKGRRAKVREESYRVGDLKSGEVRVWRVMPRSYVSWGTA